MALETRGVFSPRWKVTGSVFVACAMRTSNTHRHRPRAHSARYYRVYVKSVHKGRQQKNSYLRPFVARKRWCSRRGNPCGCPGVGGHEGRPYTKQLSYAQFLDRHGSRVRLRTGFCPRSAMRGAHPTPWMPAGACPERSRRAGMTSFPRKRESRTMRRRNYAHASTYFVRGS